MPCPLPCSVIYLFFLIISLYPSCGMLLGIDTKAEVHTSDGSIDLLIETPKFIYIIELKYDATPEQALHQIEEKQYARKFATDSRRLFRIGVSFSSETRRIEGWIIES